MRILLAMLMVTACAPERKAEEPKPPANSQAMAAALPKSTAGQSSMLMAVPSDPAALNKLIAMGYTVHDDHLHQPGVAACPKMSDNPVQ